VNSLFALFVFLLCRLTSGAFTVDSSTPTLRINLNKHLILNKIYKSSRDYLEMKLKQVFVLHKS
jgi:hypothetical protein